LLDLISCPLSVSAHSEIPCSIRVVEDGYVEARLSWFSSLPPDSFVRPHQLSSICVCAFRDPMFDSRRGRRLWWSEIVVVFLIISGQLCYDVINWPWSFPSTPLCISSAYNQITVSFKWLSLAVVRDELTAEEASSIKLGTCFVSWPIHNIIKLRQTERERETPFI